MEHKESNLAGTVGRKMFPGGFFAGTYFPPAYFPKTGAQGTHAGFRGAGKKPPQSQELIILMAEKLARRKKEAAEAMEEGKDAPELTEEEKLWTEEIALRQLAIAQTTYALVLGEV